MNIVASIFALTIVISNVRTSPVGYHFEDEDHAEITVPRSPKIQGPQIEYFLIPFGSTMENLTCEVEGIPMPKVVWLKDGVGVQQLEKPFETEFYAEEGLSVLRFPTLGSAGGNENSEDITGNYTCVAANFLGRAWKSYMVSILILPETEERTATPPPGTTTTTTILVS